MKRITAIAAITCIAASFLFSQYYNSYASLEKRFEQQSFYFSPTYVNPFGANEFSSALLGMTDQPLLNLQVNPANLSALGPKTYLYVDYRTNKELERYNDYGIMPLYEAASSSFANDIMPYPYYPYNQTKLSVEPAFSSAVLGKPLPESMPQLSIGVTYELISQSEPYYPIDIYYPLTYSSYRAMSSSPNNGVDFVSNKGHFISFFSSYQILNNASVGFRIGRSLFKRDGEYGPLVSSTSNGAYSSYNSNVNDRGQDYRLWDAALGTQISLNEAISFGATVGYFTGDVTQSERYDNINNSFSDNTNSNEYRSTYSRNWKHKGDGISIGGNTEVVMTSSLKFIGQYSYIAQNQDLILGANEYDYSDYVSTPYINGGSGTLTRNGSGDNTVYTHRLSLGLSLKTEKNISLSFGVVIASQDLSTATDEFVATDRTSYSQNEIQPYTTTHTIVDKTLSWNNSETHSDVQIPFIVAVPLNRFLSLNIGFNRRFLTVVQSEKTFYNVLKSQQYRNDTLLVIAPEQSQYNILPRTSTTTNTLSILAGVTITPIEAIEVRLTAIPYSVNNQVNLQWLAGINLLP